jgi:6-phosphogluconolactonase
VNDATPNDRLVDYGDRGQVRIVADADALAVAAADLLQTVIDEAARNDERAYVALSGGSTPKRMGELLARPPYADRIDWTRLHVFWGDERWVPLDDPESNAGEAKRGFLDRVSIPSDQIHVFDTSLDDPRMTATQYEETIQSTVASHGSLPRFDLVFLGMGDDGHTASLFPGTSAIRETNRMVVANPVPKLNTTRLTLTSPVINAARRVVFLVGGGGKADMLHNVLDGPVDVNLMPSQIVRPDGGSTLWLVDNAAAAHLDRAPGGG